MSFRLLRQAAIALGYSEPISIEQDGTVWVGVDPDRTYLDMNKINAKVEELEQEESNLRQSAQDKLLAVGLTIDEIQALLK